MLNVPAWYLAQPSAHVPSTPPAIRTPLLKGKLAMAPCGRSAAFWSMNWN
jgi:hypothetical protein